MDVFKSRGIAAKSCRTTLLDLWSTRRRRSRKAETEETKETTSGAEPGEKPARRGGRTGSRSKTGQPRRDEDWEPAGRVIKEIGAVRGGTITRAVTKVVDQRGDEKELKEWRERMRPQDLTTSLKENQSVETDGNMKKLDGRPRKNRDYHSSKYKYTKQLTGRYTDTIAKKMKKIIHNKVVNNQTNNEKETDHADGAALLFDTTNVWKRADLCRSWGDW